MFKEKGRVRLSQAISSSFLYFSLFTPSLPVHLLRSLCSFHPFDRCATFVWKWGGFGSVYDYRVQNGPSQRERGRRQGHMKEKMKSDLIDPRICGRKGRGVEWKCGHSKTQEVNPPQVLCQCLRGVPGQPSGTADIMSPPHASVWSFLKRLYEWCRWQTYMTHRHNGH